MAALDYPQAIIQWANQAEDGEIRAENQRQNRVMRRQNRGR